MRAPKFWTSDTVAAKTLAALLWPSAALYGLGAILRRRSRTHRPRARIVCVGNLTAGGTGKTPVAIALADILTARGVKVVFLTRGYGGRMSGPLLVDLERHSAIEVGDEALLLARAASTVVARDKAAGAMFADGLGAEIVILDDGHQNPSVAKDLSLVVVDAAVGFGNGRLLPAGPLREHPAKGLARADAIIVMGKGAVSLPFTGPVIAASLEAEATDELAGKSVLAFAGIGRPEKFYETLKTLGAWVRRTRSFADHHHYSASELASLRLTAHQHHLTLATTEKDYVRIQPKDRKGIVPVPVRAVFAESSVIDGLLDRLAPRRG